MLAHRSNAQWHRPAIHKETASTRECPTSSTAHPPCKKKLPVPPRPSLNRRINASYLVSTNSAPNGPDSFPSSSRPRSPDGTDRRIASGDRVSGSADRIHIPLDISIQHGHSALPPEPPSEVHDLSIIPCTASTAEEDMSQLTLDYLRR